MIRISVIIYGNIETSDLCIKNSKIILFSYLKVLGIHIVKDPF